MPHSKGFAKRTDPRSGDPVPIGQIVQDLLQEDAFSRGIPVVTLIREWPRLVGERLAAATVPVSLEGGILTVRAEDSPWGTQARSFTEEMRERAEQVLGEGSVRAVRVVVAPQGNHGKTAGR
jgi:predicted nucleic acid-binding Zn ribbon protein